LNDIIEKLNAPLDGSRVRQFGSNAGSKAGLSYLEGHDVIRELNKVFDFQWSHRVVSCELMFEKTVQNRSGKEMVLVCYKAQVEISTCGLDNPYIHHDGIGTGSSQMYPSNVADAHEVAMKEAETDALKRAAMKFGDRFGLALYDKEHKNVAAPYDPTRAAGELFTSVVKTHNLDKTAAKEHIQAAIKSVNGGELVPYATFDAETAAKIDEAALTTAPKEFK